MPAETLNLSLSQFLLVALGGATGSVLRWTSSTIVAAWTKPSSFPWGTTAVNLAGCFVIGLLMGAAEYRGALGPNARLLLVTGLVGGFTTFSTFGFETVQLLRAGRAVAAAASVLLQVGVGIGAIVAGLALARR